MLKRLKLELTGYACLLLVFIACFWMDFEDSIRKWSISREVVSTEQMEKKVIAYLTKYYGDHHFFVQEVTPVSEYSRGDYGPYFLPTGGTYEIANGHAYSVTVGSDFSYQPIHVKASYPKGEVEWDDCVLAYYREKSNDDDPMHYLEDYVRNYMNKKLPATLHASFSEAVTIYPEQINWRQGLGYIPTPEELLDGVTLINHRVLDFDTYWEKWETRKEKLTEFAIYYLNDYDYSPFVISNEDGKDIDVRFPNKHGQLNVSGYILLGEYVFDEKLGYYVKINTDSLVSICVDGSVDRYDRSELVRERR